ncbi:MAG: methyltransferase domain-containing protein [Pirellulales bacterium]
MDDKLRGPGCGFFGALIVSVRIELCKAKLFPSDQGGMMLQYWILKKLFPVSVNKPSKPLVKATQAILDPGSSALPPIDLAKNSKLESHFGKDVWEKIQGKTVLDFGCGTGAEAVTIALNDARHVTGIDIRQSVLDEARAFAKKCCVERCCTFTTEISGLFDIIISQDAFEHYENPEAVLGIMKKHLAPQGEIWISFGPPWFHPRGAHLPSLFPWAHLVFSEKALMRWRADFKTDGATVFSEVEGGLNKMTLFRFIRMIKESGLVEVYRKAVPIRVLARYKSIFPKEFITSVVIEKLKAKC